jgi:hypothetical protein
MIKHQPDASTRRLIVALASCGIQQKRIAKHAGIAEKTLRRAYRAELDLGVECAVAGAASNMFRVALKPTMAGFRAAQFVLGRLGGPAWKAPRGAAINLIQADMVDPDPAGSARELLSTMLDKISEQTLEFDPRQKKSE